MSPSPTEIFAERLAVQARQHDATDPRLIACHFTAGWLAAVDALNAKGLTQDLAPTTPTPDADADDGWREHTPGAPMPCNGGLLVDVVFADGQRSYDDYAGEWGNGPFDWWVSPQIPSCQITKWRPARTQPQP